jgi:hypothetical protein
MPTLATPRNFPASEGKRQCGSPATMSSQPFSLQHLTMCPSETAL